MELTELRCIKTEISTESVGGAYVVTLELRGFSAISQTARVDLSGVEAGPDGGKAAEAAKRKIVEWCAAPSREKRPGLAPGLFAD